MIRRGGRVVGVLLGVLGVCGVALAHGGSLRDATAQELAVPTWLFLSTGGAVVGASFLLASFVTDRALVAAIHDWSVTLPGQRFDVRQGFAWLGRIVGLVGVALVVLAGLRGPTQPLRNAAIVLVWVGWWAGYVMTTYLVGNTWPAIDPFRTITRVLPSGSRSLDDEDAAWASTLFLLALVWFEVVSPLADEPPLLAGAALGYLTISAAGVLAVGHDSWFGRIDPLSRLFRMYGAVAPVQRTDSGLQLRLPATKLSDDLLSNPGDVAFVVALLWGTTYDGLVGTPAWASFARPVVSSGVPAPLLYPAALLVGFYAFYWVFQWAARTATETAPTYADAGSLARRFAPSLLAIAAGYHLAHYLLYFLSLSPTLAGLLSSPLNPPIARTLVLPGWLSGIAVAAVLVGHLFAIWVAHTTAFETFPGRLQSIRSQYPLTLVMVFYTMTSLWIVGQPAVTPPFL
jgi:hypothetical protein